MAIPTSTRCRTLWIMPRVAGVSFSSTVWRMRRRPEAAARRSPDCSLNPIGLFISVTLTVAPFVSGSVDWP